MKALCFLIEREHSPSSDVISMRARIAERLWVRALFWCADTEDHTLDVVAHAPDDSRVTVGRLTRACQKAPGLLSMECRLHPLGAAGWHRLHLVLDDRDMGVSKPVFVLGPARSVSRYLGRGEPLPAAEPNLEADEPASAPLKKTATNRRDPRG